MKTNLIDLPGFMPYQLAVAADVVGKRLARLYADRFGLSIPEWRVIAVIARYPGLSANGVAEQGALDKVQVSRAVSRLTERGLIERRVAETDRRRSELSLSDAGRAIYQEIVPLALKEEARMLDRLTADERQQFAAVLTRLSMQQPG